MSQPAPQEKKSDPSSSKATPVPESVTKDDSVFLIKTLEIPAGSPWTRAELYYTSCLLPEASGWKVSSMPKFQKVKDVSVTPAQAFFFEFVSKHRLSPFPKEERHIQDPGPGRQRVVFRRRPAGHYPGTLDQTRTKGVESHYSDPGSP